VAALCANDLAGNRDHNVSATPILKTPANFESWRAF